MSPVRFPSLRLPVILRTPKVLPATSASFFHTRPTSPEPNRWMQASAGDGIPTAMSFLDSCDDPTLLHRAHARILRTGTLHSHTSPFPWNCLMRAYLRLDRPFLALRLYALMSRSSVPPDSYTVPIALKATCFLFALDLGMQIHGSALKRGLRFNEYCESGLICVYAKVGDVGAARKLFDENPQRKLGSWNAIISGFAQMGRSEEAVDLFVELRRCGLVPDDVTMVSVASACGALGDSELAQQVHTCALQARFRESGRCTEVQLHNSLLDMYGKCGRTDLAHMVFSRMRRRDVSTWTAMITSFAMQGLANEAVALFRCMVSEGSVQPNHVTFVSVLTACAHGGLVEEGMFYFRQMAAEYGIHQTATHYGCVVDMLGRVGRLEEARGVVEGMPAGEVNSVVLGTLIGACEKYGDVEVGQWVAAKLVELEPWNDGVYVVLSNIYASRGLWGEVERVRRQMREKSLSKVPGYSMAALSV